MRRRPVVAIDGPAGAGKSTVTRAVAERLGYLLVDTGALYRALALAADRAGVSWDDADRVGKLAAELVARGALRAEQAEAGPMKVWLDGEDVSGAIRTQRISQGASKVSASPGVRDALLALQRDLGRDGGVVLEGRDIGTVVFPDAEAKIFLTASVEVRAERRHRELLDQGGEPRLDQVRDEVMERDRRDTERPVAPLRQAPDAVLIDSSAIGIDEVVRRVVDHVRNVELSLSGATS